MTVKYIVTTPNKNNHSLGSWRDILSQDDINTRECDGFGREWAATGMGPLVFFKFRLLQFLDILNSTSTCARLIWIGEEKISYLSIKSSPLESR